MNHECPHNKACIQEKCQNPCTKSCGLNAKCDVVNHTPFCTCESGYEGDAFISCSRIPPSKLNLKCTCIIFIYLVLNNNCNIIQ